MTLTVMRGLGHLVRYQCLVLPKITLFSSILTILLSSYPEAAWSVVLHCTFSLTQHPPLLTIELWGGVHACDPFLQVRSGNGEWCYMLRGMIYFAAEHFTAHLITHSGLVQFHDGLFTDCSLVYKASTPALVPVRDLILAIYTQENSDMPSEGVAH